MLPKKNRADRKAVEKIFKEGRFVNSQNLTLKFIIDKEAKPGLPGFASLSFPQISFVVPKTVSKKAVIRNLLRRRGYAVLKPYLGTFPAGFTGVFLFGKKSKDIFGGRKNKTRNPIQDLENEIKIILNKIH